MSTFVLKREYALQLPNSYVEIDRDEMEYVDGGGPTAHLIEKSIDKRLISVPVNAIGWYFTGGLVGKGMELVGKVASKAMGGVLSAVGIANVASNFTGSWWNFGDHLANYLDSIDRDPGNGRIDYLDTVYY